MTTQSISTLGTLVLAALFAAPGAAAAQSKPAEAATTAAAATNVRPWEKDEYRLGPGDKLRIEVYKDTQLSQSLQVRPDGKITLPLVGDIPAAGRTSIELRNAIAGALEEYIAKPVVTVIVTETTPQVVYITGEVNKPGALPVANGQMSIIQAIAMAGGFTDFANKKDIRVLRKGASGMQTLRFNYKEAIEDENRREPLPLLPGDTVIVK
jgi:polysaccharide export outer membrane protein